MIKINENYQKLQASYLFSDIAKRVNAHVDANPDEKIIRLGIGDVTRALPDACVKAFHAAVDEMASDSSFHGYGPEQGYDFLREAIARVISSPVGPILMPMRCSSAMVPSVIPVISRRYSLLISRSLSLIRSIRSMSIPT